MGMRVTLADGQLTRGGRGWPGVGGRWVEAGGGVWGASQLPALTRKILDTRASLAIKLTRPCVVFIRLYVSL